MNCELVVAGNLSLDDVSLPDGSRQENVIGGDALYGALGARLWCPGVGMLSRRAGDFSPESLQRCREAGIDLAGVPLFPGASLHSLAVYRADGGRQFTELSPPGTREAMSPRAEDIPPPTGAAGRPSSPPCPSTTSGSWPRHSTARGPWSCWTPTRGTPAGGGRR